jgi:hypothetical protein
VNLCQDFLRFAVRRHHRGVGLVFATLRTTRVYVLPDHRGGVITESLKACSDRFISVGL